MSLPGLSKQTMHVALDYMYGCTPQTMEDWVQLQEAEEQLGLSDVSELLQQWLDCMYPETLYMINSLPYSTFIIPSPTCESKLVYRFRQRQLETK